MSPSSSGLCGHKSAIWCGSLASSWDMNMHKVIFDTDPGIDDAMALLFLHRHPDADLIGITTVFGNAPIELTTRNAMFLKAEWGIAAPVAKGAGTTFDPARPAEI